MNLLSYINYIILNWLFMSWYCTKITTLEIDRRTKSLEEIALHYEDDKNSMIAVTEKGQSDIYEDFYDDMDNRIIRDQSMNMIFFGPPTSFMRLDPETILHIFTNAQHHLIPISRALLAWDIITDGKTAAFLQGREFLAFGILLNSVPEEDLYYVNFGDKTVLAYFANNFIQLEKRKIGVLIAAYRRYYGNDWHRNSTYINELGYLICGFPAFDLARISPATFKDLTNEVLGKLQRCNYNQTKTLYEIATHPDAYDHPYKWTSHEIGKLDVLFTYIPREDISSLQLEAVTAISPSVMKQIDQNKLQYFSKHQILSMNSKTRRIYILRMQLRNSLDMSEIVKQCPSCG